MTRVKFAVQCQALCQMVPIDHISEVPSSIFIPEA